MSTYLLEDWRASPLLRTLWGNRLYQEQAGARRQNNPRSACVGHEDGDEDYGEVSLPRAHWRQLL
eukprot:1407998-Prorocentrum_lima.AAC.1